MNQVSNPQTGFGNAIGILDMILDKNQYELFNKYLEERHYALLYDYWLAITDEAIELNNKNK